MPHVSPRPVKEKVRKQLYALLFESLTSKNVTKKQQRLAFQELLTPTEKMMLSKRLVAISLLSQGISSYKVGRVLQLSNTTTIKLQEKLERGSFKNTTVLCKILRKGPLQHYIEGLFKLPRYGTSPSQLFKEK
ncbi:MAG: hypothetical protein WDZ90_00090 [Candidatus Paceibacterota bacterium]